MSPKAWPLLVLTLLSPLAHAQWDRVYVGAGGEPNIATDGKGNVYETCHLNAQFFTSHDWAASFTRKKSFSNACCDLAVLTTGTGSLLVTYLAGSVTGIKNWVSTDFGETLVAGTAPSGSLDREWTGIDPSSGAIYMDYSNGYIGGPASSGVYCSKSTDGGLTFSETARCDNETGNNHAVDPYMAVGTTGRVYSMWTSTSDLNTIDKVGFSYSTDGGASFTGHKTLLTLNKAGDTQERWMLGSIVATGPKRVVAFFANYMTVNVDGVDYLPLLVFYSMSLDGGVTFTAPMPLSPMEEIQTAIRSFVANKLGNANVPYYVQTLAWACADPFGRLHVVWWDNRDGQALLNAQPYDQWHVRHAEGLVPFGKSERVSGDVVMLRPPLDFIGCAADQSYTYVTYVETPNSTNDWNFTGNLYVARKPTTPIGPIRVFAH